MRPFRSPVPLHHAPGKMGHGGVALPLRYLPAALRLHDAVDGDLALVPQDGVCRMPENEPGGIQRLGIKERKLLLYGFLQSRTRFPVRDRVMREVHMEPRPCGLPLLRLHIVPARHHNKRHILPDFFFQIFRMNPVCRIVGMGIVAVHHVHIAGEEIVPTPAAVLKFCTHMVERRHLHAIVLIVNDTLFRVQAVLRVPPAIRRVKCHFQDNPTSSQFSVK